MRKYRLLNENTYSKFKDLAKTSLDSRCTCGGGSNKDNGDKAQPPPPLPPPMVKNSDVMDAQPKESEQDEKLPSPSRPASPVSETEDKAVPRPLKRRPSTLDLKPQNTETKRQKLSDPPQNNTSPTEPKKKKPGKISDRWIFFK